MKQYIYWHNRERGIDEIYFPSADLAEAEQCHASSCIEESKCAGAKVSMSCPRAGDVCCAAGQYFQVNPISTDILRHTNVNT